MLPTSAGEKKGPGSYLASLHSSVLRIMDLIGSSRFDNSSFVSHDHNEVTTARPSQIDAQTDKDIRTRRWSWIVQHQVHTPGVCVMNLLLMKGGHWTWMPTKMRRTNSRQYRPVMWSSEEMSSQMTGMIDAPLFSKTRSAWGDDIQAQVHAARDSYYSCRF